MMQRHIGKYKYIYIGPANDKPTNFRSIVDQLLFDYCIYANNMFFHLLNYTYNM